MERNLSLPVKLLCAVFALALCLPLAACGVSKGSSVSSSTSDEAKEAEAGYAEKLFDTDRETCRAIRKTVHQTRLPW